MKVATAPQFASLATTSPAPQQPAASSPPSAGPSDSYSSSPRGSMVKENITRFACHAAYAAGIAALTTAFAPEGAGFSHAIRGLALTAGSTVAGAVVGGCLGDSIAKFSSKVGGTSHSADERLGDAIGGLLIGGGTGAVAGIASSFFHQGPLAAAATAAVVVTGLGLATTIADKFHK